VERSSGEPFRLSGLERRFIERALTLDLVDNRSRRLSCLECGTTSPYERGWQARVTFDEPPKVAIYCPECAEREFGPWA
jgi:RNase P subunit RPR2